MDSYQELTQLLANLRQKYSYLNGIMDSTRQLQELAEQGDMESFGFMLDARGKSMQQIDRLTAENDEILGRLPEPLGEKIRGCIRPKSSAAITLENPLQTNIYDLSKHCAEILKRIVDADAELTAKVEKLKGRE